MIDIRYPHITGKTNEEKIDQLHRYLIYLTDQLNYVLETSNAGQNRMTDAEKKEVAEIVKNSIPFYDGKVIQL